MPRRNPFPSPAVGTTHRFSLLAGWTHEATLTPVTLRRPGKRGESGAAPSMAINPTVPQTYLYPRDTLWSLLTTRSRLTLRGGKKKKKKKPDQLLLLHSYAIICLSRDVWPCPCPLQPHEGLPLHPVAKEVLDAGLEKWPQRLPCEEGASGAEGRGGLVGGHKMPNFDFCLTANREKKSKRERATTRLCPGGTW